MPALSLRGQLEPWPIGDLGSDDPLTPRVTRAVMNNINHLVDSQCQHLVSWVSLAGASRTLTGVDARPRLVWSTLVPVSRRPDGRYAQLIVQLLISSATLGAVTWYAVVTPPGDTRVPGIGTRSSVETATTSSTTPVWTPTMPIRPDATSREELRSTSLAVGAAQPLVVTVGVGWAMCSVWASGLFVPILSGVSIREFCE